MAVRGMRALFSAGRSKSRASFTTVKYSETGDPYKVLSAEADSSANTKPGKGQVALKMLFAPLNGLDVDQIEGRGGAKAKLPAVAGQDGLGEIIAVGADVKGLSQGDWVVPTPGSSLGTWTTAPVIAAEMHVQSVSKNIPAEYASALGLNASVAYRLLKDFVDLKEGDVIIQTAANSAIGMTIVQIAKSMGVKTINVMRGRPEEEQSPQALSSMGADFIVWESYLHTPDFYDLLSDLPPPRLALDTVGGRVTADTLRALGSNGKLVTYGNLSGEAVRLPESVLKSRKISVSDFSLAEWYKNSKPEQQREMLSELGDMVAAEKLIMFFETHPFSQISNALDKYYEPYKYRKVLLDMSI